MAEGLPTVDVDKAVAPTRQPRIGIYDLLALLFQAWVCSSLISFFLFADRGHPENWKVIGIQELPWQGLFFLIAFALALCLRLRFPEIGSWHVTSLLILCSLAAQALYSDSFPLLLGFLILCLPVFWSGRPFLFKEGPLARRVLQGLTFIPFSLILILFLIKFPARFRLPSPQLSGLDLSGAGWQRSAVPLHGAMFSEREFWIFLLIATGAAILFSFRLTFEYAHQRKRIRPLKPFPFRLLMTAACVVLAAAAAYHMYFLGQFLLARIWGFKTPSFDFGLFTQMFHAMRRHGLPLTTLERDGLFSHFRVHLSPIYYLLLPFFMLFPKAETLQIAQILVVVSGVLPLSLLARELRLKPLPQVFLATLYLLLPGLIGSSFYDLHENCFLAPLCLWLFYAGLRNKLWAMLLSALLVLAVKEDAALYVVSASLWFIFSAAPRQADAGGRKRLRIHAAVLILLALAVFFFEIAWLQSSGAGAMTNRFKNLMIYPRLSLLGIPLSFFQNPYYLLNVIFHPAKLRYLILSLVSVGLIPLFSKRKSDYLLFLPLLMMNLLSDYVYQYSLSFQYHYGSHSFLIFALLLALSALPSPFSFRSDGAGIRLEIKRAAAVSLLAAALASSFVLSHDALGGAREAAADLRGNAECYQSIRDTLQKIPRDKRVACSSFLSTELADCAELYDIEFNESIAYGREVDILLFDLRDMSAWNKTVSEWYRDHGYRYHEQWSGHWVAVLVNEKTMK